MAAQLVKSVARRADSRARRRIDRAGANRFQARDAWPAKPQYRIRTNSRISDADKPRSQERQPSSRACASRQTLIFIEIASRKLDCTQCFFDFSATHRHGGQRGIYLTFGDTCVINAVRKAALCHQMCPQRLAAKHKTSVPLVLCPRSSGA
ncbi:hypothetical protein Turpa_3370 [Turneriella parva DSM 21527]|uniref:Uncharacterized protein n=1 Tax=Turneriella parva (strain ATCC BAA-1111 / DSM 21527 / NCTC 11395 / H) TaxID=869212 RepID=I4B9Q1_TURPD|nr:hypothetical protein Turpa_3370 [Turneriella parva DSM 21527]